MSMFRRSVLFCFAWVELCPSSDKNQTRRSSNTTAFVLDLNSQTYMFPFLDILHITHNLVERGYNFQPKFRIKMSYFTSFLGKPTRSFMNGTDFLPQNPHWTIWTCMWHYYWCHTFYKLSKFPFTSAFAVQHCIVSIICWTLDSSSIWSLCYWHCCITLLTNIRKWNRSIKGTRTADWTVVCGIQDHSLYMLVHTTQRI